MRVLLSLAPPVPGALVDAVIDAPAGTTTAEVGRLLGPALGAAGRPPGAGVRVGGRRLPDDALLGLPPLVHGAVLSDAAGPAPSGPSASAAGALEVRAVGGPDAGVVRPLTAGSVRLGRACGADVVVHDAAVSRCHAEVDVGWDGVTVRDLGSTHGTFLDGVRVGSEPVPWSPDDLLCTGGTTWALACADRAVAATTADGAGSLAVNLPPRLPAPATAVEVTLPDALVERDRSRLPVVALVAPLVAGVVLAAVLANATFLLFTLLSPVMLAGQWWSDRRQHGRQARRERARHAERSAAAQARVAAALEAEARVRRAAAPDAVEVLRTATGPGTRLYERRRSDPDALVLRLGLGTLPARTRVRDPARDPTLAPRPPEQVHDVPVTVALAGVGAMGLAGPRRLVLGSARWVLAQLAVLHAPQELEVVVLAPGRARDWAATRWLPHCRPSRGQDCLALLGLDEASVGARVADLAGELSRRTADGAGAGGWTGPRTVVLLDGALTLRRSPVVAAILRDGPRVGMHAVCLADHPAELPAECGARATLSPGAVGLRVDVAGCAPVEGARPDGVRSGWFERVARALAPLQAAAPATDDVPSTCRLVDLASTALGGSPDRLTSEDVVARWAEPPTTRVLLGVAPSGPLTVDLARDGPHALVAGTTGAGKSELLQALVVGLALGNRPEDLQLLLVDYKGGAAFAACARLPHTAGLVTDLDPHLTRRALASLRAELRRREQVLRGAGVADVAELRPPAHPRIARLVVVVDEFAALAQELPDFVRGLVGVAQRGRSLGVHLVLATQRPAGAVSADVRANTTLRIALRVTDDVDSRDVIDSPLAAAIPHGVPGRGYLRVGAAGPVPFQAARVGGAPPPAVRAVPTVTLVHPARWGDPRCGEAPGAEVALGGAGRAA